MIFSRRKPGALPDEPQPEREKIGPLEFLGAEEHLVHGYWVYALHEENGHVFYVGHSEAWLGRLREHYYNYFRRFHYYSLISCRNAYHMKLTENWLIDQLQPEENFLGTAKAERERWVSQHQSNQTAKVEGSSVKAIMLRRPLAGTDTDTETESA